MKPLLLQGHERAITQIKYNREGDLLFSSSKDKTPNVWFAINGERLGTYVGHQGTVWCIDVDWNTTNFLTGSADSSIKLWDCRTGVEKTSFTLQNMVRTCGFSFSGNLILYSTDKALRSECSLFVRDIRMPNDSAPISQIQITPTHSKITSAIWGPLEDTIVTGHETGEIINWDLRKQEVIKKTKPHSRQIMDLQADKDGMCFISASKDTMAKLFDLSTLAELKTYKTEKPVNSACISPTKDHVLLGGGQEAVDAALTKAGKFEARFFHLVFEEEFARVRDHFGPINSVAIHPDGKSYSSGGEDGYIRVHNFDQSYFDFEIEC